MHKRTIKYLVSCILYLHVHLDLHTYSSLLLLRSCCHILCLIIAANGSLWTHRHQKLFFSALIHRHVWYIYFTLLRIRAELDIDINIFLVASNLLLFGGVGKYLYTPFTLGHGSHDSGHRCRTSAKRD